MGATDDVVRKGRSAQATDVEDTFAANDVDDQDPRAFASIEQPARRLDNLAVRLPGDLRDEASRLRVVAQALDRYKATRDQRRRSLRIVQRNEASDLVEIVERGRGPYQR